MKYCPRFVFLLAAAWASLTACDGQPPDLNGPNGKPPAGESTGDQLPASKPVAAPRAERDALSGKLRVAQLVQPSAQKTANPSDAKPREQLQREMDLLKQLEVTLAQLKSAKSQHADLLARLSDLTAQLQSVREVGPHEEQPYSFLLLDHLRDELTASRSLTDTHEAVAGSIPQAVTRAKVTLDAGTTLQHKLEPIRNISD